MNLVAFAVVQYLFIVLLCVCVETNLKDKYHVNNMFCGIDVIQVILYMTYIIDFASKSKRNL